jgi:hypothetical protein
MPFQLYCLDFPNGKKYIGQSERPLRRLAQHKLVARRGSRFPVHAAIRRYGNPLLHVLCIGERDYIAALEIKAIEAFKTRDRRRFGYNVSLGGDISPAVTPEARAKISAALTGRAKSLEERARLSAAAKAQPRPPCSPETRAKIGAANKARLRPPLSIEHRANLSAAGTGKPCSTETRAKLSAAAKGRVISATTRAKLSAAAKGRPARNKGIPHSAEARAKISAAQKGRPGHPQTPEARAKLSASRKGRSYPGHPCSPETRIKLRAAKLAFELRKRFPEPSSPSLF